MTIPGYLNGYYQQHVAYYLLLCGNNNVQRSNYGLNWVYNIYSDSFGSPMFKDYSVGKNINKLSWRNFEYLGQMPFWVGEIKVVIISQPITLEI